jgi:mono/diheme cytochrome c family protein
MRHVAVQRLTVLLAVAFLLYALAFAWLVRDEPTAPPARQEPLGTGAVLFGRYCAACHLREDLRQALRARGVEVRGSPETFLRQHGDASDAEDHLILDYLMAPGP